MTDQESLESVYLCVRSAQHTQDAFSPLAGVAQAQIQSIDVDDAQAPVRVVRLDYDPAQVSIATIAHRFWLLHDPSRSDASDCSFFAWTRTDQAAIYAATRFRAMEAWAQGGYTHEPDTDARSSAEAGPFTPA